MSGLSSFRVAIVAATCLVVAGCSVASGGAASASCSPAPSAAPTLFLVSPIAGSTVASLTKSIYIGIQPNTYTPLASSITLTGADGTQIVGGPLIAVTTAPNPAATPGNTQPYALFESNVTTLESPQTYTVSVTISESATLTNCGATSATLGTFQTT